MGRRDNFDYHPVFLRVGQMGFSRATELNVCFISNVICWNSGEETKKMKETVTGVTGKRIFTDHWV